MVWWEMVVKPGIRKRGIKRSKELNMEKRESLNLLLLRQCYLTRKLQLGRTNHLSELKLSTPRLSNGTRRKVRRFNTSQGFKNFKAVKKPPYITMNYTRGPLKEMPSSNCRQTKVLLKDMASVQLFWKSLLRIFSSAQLLLINMHSKYYWMRWSLCSVRRIMKTF